VTRESPNTFEHHVRVCVHQLATDGVAALAALFDLTATRLVRYASTLTRNQHDAEDAVQSALVRIAAAPNNLSKATYPWPYLLRVVRNEALRIVKRKRRVSPISDLSDILIRVAVDECHRLETKQAVWKALRKLPPDQSEVVVLKIWEGMTFAQIAVVIGKSPNTVASRYQYAMGKLKHHLQRLPKETIRD
jgi:RNA polymerase sigma-70 factor (ECF subfamily)